MSFVNQSEKSFEEESKKKKQTGTTASEKSKSLSASQVVVCRTYNANTRPSSSQTRKHSSKQYETLDVTLTKTERKLATAAVTATARKMEAEGSEKRPRYGHLRDKKGQRPASSTPDDKPTRQYRKPSQKQADAKGFGGPTDRGSSAKAGGSGRAYRPRRYENPDCKSTKAKAQTTTASTEFVTNTKSGGNGTNHYTPHCVKPERTPAKVGGSTPTLMAESVSTAETEGSVSPGQAKLTKRQRQKSSTPEDNAAQQQKSSATPAQPGSYRDTNKWRKLQRGPLEMSRTARRWHQVQQAPQGTPGMEFSVMSYNILSQKLLEGHRDLYTQCRTQDLEWPQRGAAILREIISCSADIICLQEVEMDHWNHDIRPVLNYHGYYGLYKKKIGKPDGCAVLYKKSKFTHVRFVPVMFLKGGVLDRDNVGIIVLLKPNPHLYKGEVNTICVATTHLLFNPRRGDVKLAQLMMFLAEIDKVAAVESHPAQKNWKHGTSHCSQLNQPKSSQTQPHKSQDCSEKAHSHLRDIDPSATTQKIENSAADTCSSHQRYCPIILCGDFNAEPLCDLYRFVTTGQLKYEGLVSRFICGQREGIQSGSNVYLSHHLLPSHLEITETCQYLRVLRGRHNSLVRSNGQFKQYNPQNSFPVQHHGEDENSKNSPLDQSQPSDSGILQNGLNICLVGMSAGQKFVQEIQSQSLTVNEAAGMVRQESINVTRNESACVVSQEPETDFHPPKTNSGRAYHSMNFKSVYTHFTEFPGRDGRKLLEVSSQHDKCSATVDYIFYTSCPPQSKPGKTPLQLLARYSLLTRDEIANTGHLPNATFPSDHLSLAARFFLQ